MKKLALFTLLITGAWSTQSQALAFVLLNTNDAVTVTCSIGPNQINAETVVMSVASRQPEWSYTPQDSFCYTPPNDTINCTAFVNGQQIGTASSQIDSFPQSGSCVNSDADAQVTQEAWPSWRLQADVKDDCVYIAQYN